MNWKNLAGWTACSIVLGLGASRDAQAAELVSNGDFSAYTYNSGTFYPGSQLGGQLGYNVTATGWSIAPNAYNFLFKDAATATTPGGVNSEYGPLYLWGPNNSPATTNGFTASTNGGAFLALDAAFNTSGGPSGDVGKAVFQSISGLTIGQQYTIQFEWATAQQHGFNGATTEAVSVGFGNTYLGDTSFVGSSYTTSTLNTPDHGFNPWRTVSYTFTATTTSGMLSFLASGGPPGVPPFVLLDGVSMQQAVPEPSSLVLSALGLAGLVGVGLRRRSRTTAA